MSVECLRKLPLVPRDAFGGGEPFINEIKRLENEQRLMRALMHPPSASGVVPGRRS